MTVDAANVRQRVWADLRKVARPDSRFHWDFSSYIADFDGSERCSELVLGHDAYRALGGRRLFVTPDNSTEDLRRRLILDGRPFTITTYGIVRGFLDIDPKAIERGEARYAATLDGADRFGRPVSLRELAAGPGFGLLVTGSAAVSRNGVRFGKGHGYFDLEWAMLSDLKLVDRDTVIIAIVHDCQVVPEDLTPKPHDVVVDWIATPTRLIRVDHPDRPPGTVRWDQIRGGELERLDVIAELSALLKKD